jgi:hypothetical protein
VDIDAPSSLPGRPPRGRQLLRDDAAAPQCSPTCRSPPTARCSYAGGMPPLRIVDLGDHRIGYDSDHDETLVQLDWFFGSRSEGVGSPDLDVHVEESVVVSPDDFPPDRHDGPIEQWHRAEELVLRHELGPCARITDTTFDITSVAHVEQSWRALRHLLFSGLAWWLERRNVVLVHGAMIARGPDAILVLGDTGSGKSTAALAAFAAGWELCSDDLVLARADEPSVSLFGLPKRATVDRDLVRQLDLPLDEVPNDERRRVMLPNSTLAGGWRRLSLVLIVGHHDGAGAAERIEHSDALDAVFRSYVEADQPATVRRQLHCLSIMAGTPALRLLHAAEHGDRLARAAELLEVAWHQARTESRQ